jgi:sugar/nucleoside kinase (ribokinase family)
VPGTYDAVVAGHICLDVIPNLADIAQDKLETMFLPGRLVEVGRVAFSSGGPVSNTGLALNKLGSKTQLMGKVGDDLFGQTIKGIINCYDPHLADGMVVTKTASTSYTIIINLPGVDRIFLHCPGANDTFGADDVRYDLVSRTRLFHFGYPPLMRTLIEDDGAQLVEIFQRVKRTGVTTSLDMALPDPSSAAGRADWATILKATLPYVDIFLPSGEEILYMLRRQLYDELRQEIRSNDILPLITPQMLSDLSQELVEMGAKIIGIKLGRRGLYMRTADPAAVESMGHARPSKPAAWANKELWAPAFKVKEVGATGAGDAAIAGFLSALLRDMPPQAALTAAAAVGACNVEAADGLSGIRAWDETLRRVADGWLQHELDIEAPGWRFNGDQRLWVTEVRS